MFARLISQQSLLLLKHLALVMPFIESVAYFVFLDIFSYNPLCSALFSSAGYAISCDDHNGP